jgi:S1-C subfamily serine protease
VPQTPTSAVTAEPAADAAPQSRASLGVTLSDNKQGKVWIRNVQPGSGADQAGLRSNDQIVAIDTRQIFTYLDVIRIVNLKGASEDIQVHILRNGKPGMLTASLGSQYAGNPPQGTFTEYPAGTPAVSGAPSNALPPEFVNPNGVPPVAQPPIQP